MGIELVTQALHCVSGERVRWRSGEVATRGDFALRRAWPKSAEHMLMELRTTEDRVFGGQWFVNSSQAEEAVNSMLRDCPGCPVGVCDIMGGTLVVHGNGADNAMPKLAHWASLDGAEILVHRPTRRAVVKVPFQESVCYAKIVPRKRIEELAATSRRVQQIGSLVRGAFSVAQIMHEECDRAGGVVVWKSLAGSPLSSLMNTPAFEAAAFRTGRALRALHDVPVIQTHEWTLPCYGAQEVVEELERWIERTCAFDSALAASVGRQLRELTAGCALDRTASHTLVHRDFHDKQVFVDETGVGLLDFDTLSVGDPRVDVGNFVAHIELRCQQDRLSNDDARQAIEAFLRGYQLPAALQKGVDAYRQLTKLRLQCVYAFRTSRVSGESGAASGVLQPRA